MLSADALNELVSLCPHRQNGVSWILDCPRCGKRDKLYIRKRDGRFVCWVCQESHGYAGAPEYALRDLLSWSIPKLREKLYGDSGPAGDHLDLPTLYGQDPEDELAGEVPGPPSMSFPLDFFPIDHPHSENGAAYLASRGIPLPIALEYGIQYHPRQQRVIFPMEVDGRLVGWQARTIKPHSVWNEELQRVCKVPKILTPQGVDKGRILMFQDRLQGSRHAVLCEGPVSAMKAHKCGGNVATMGKNVSPAQIEILRASGVERVYLALDPDAAFEAGRLCQNLHDLELFLLHPSVDGDLGDMDIDSVHDLFLRAPEVDSAMYLSHRLPY